MTRCSIRNEFFDGSYQITVKNKGDKEMIEREDAGYKTKTLIEFGMPFSELKHIVDGMIVEDTQLGLNYPFADNMLRVQIPEEFRIDNKKLKTMTTLQLETYEAAHTLDRDISFKRRGIAAEFYGRVFHFKKALREFSWLDPTDLVALRVSTYFPRLQFIYERKNYARHHAVKFNENLEEFAFK